MRTTIDISEELLSEAMRVSHVKTKTMAIVLGLQELVNKARWERLRALRGKLDLVVDIRRSRRR